MSTCKECKKATQNPNFCSRSCSAKYNNRGNRRHGKPDTACAQCGSATRNIKFCSNKCNSKFTKEKHNRLVVEGRSSNKVARRYLQENFNHCNECGIPKFWNNKPLTLQCDHIDGDCTNNQLSNLRLLCPNCHTQTKTYGSKNTNNPHGIEKRKARIRYHRLGSVRGNRTPMD